MCLALEGIDRRLMVAALQMIACFAQGRLHSQYGLQLIAETRIIVGRGSGQERQKREQQHHAENGARRKPCHKRFLAFESGAVRD